MEEMGPDGLEADLARRAAQAAGARLQDLLNARRVPERRFQTDARVPIPVRVRLNWAVDGEEWVEADAVGWFARRGYKAMARVQLRREVRARTVCVWLDVDDVERR